MAEMKTRATQSDVAVLLDRAEPEQRRVDGKVLAETFARVTGETATMWGPSIVGYGRYRYRYESGREGESCRVGFSPRKAALVLYVDAGSHDALLARLGKHSTGKGCLYVKKLADVDGGVLEQVIAAAWADNRARYPD
ncbi:DUF1801 domain-containing protein [Sphingomonas sp. SUN019]|uniref:DUF1801 domain-containing protein n=1 Tax=Sphingomonas sp. SUN019 TaxID=2937788 RepID=UPI0021647C3D|nr:DUF1801 domain-containing protein [Sphingomonas sp. SUN019]UVO51422.1 DUF1801 domain-containing protein [Sphingomonas sp. SUN019]